ncbi:MAG TPA: class I SAM-dependent methyltransferase [Chryseosolibacter sp.]|nr:class I SAM-dependent methyltransferase [Chryseosolibacter sp.]
MSVKDYFSNHSKIYAAFRPVYPTALYDYILPFVKEKHTAWDVATGNGQVATVLADVFTTVHATDISKAQLESAFQKKNINYSVGRAEESDFPDGEFDLVTVGQALHWFNLPLFYNEVRRVLKSDGIVAVWGYAILKVSPDIDKHFLHFYNNIVGPYWDDARKLVEDEYATIPFPFHELPSKQFQIVVEWDADQFAGYLTSWSATQKFIRAHGFNPVDDFMRSLQPFWKRHEVKIVSFPVFLRLGRV